MGKYLDIARRVSEERTTPEGTPTDATGAVCAESTRHRLLLAAGWVLKERTGKTIWASPHTGFWYCEEMAGELARLDEEPRGEGA